MSVSLCASSSPSKFRQDNPPLNPANSKGREMISAIFLDSVVTSSQPFGFRRDRREAVVLLCQYATLPICISVRSMLPVGPMQRRAERLRSSQSWSHTPWVDLAAAKGLVPVFEFQSGLFWRARGTSDIYRSYANGHSSLHPHSPLKPQKIGPAC
jgi:hypothetical protein